MTRRDLAKPFFSVGDDKTRDDNLAKIDMKDNNNHEEKSPTERRQTNSRKRRKKEEIIHDTTRLPPPPRRNEGHNQPVCLFYFPLGDRRSMSTPADAHVLHDPLMICEADLERDCGKRIGLSLFSPPFSFAVPPVPLNKPSLCRSRAPALQGTQTKNRPFNQSTSLDQPHR